MRPYPVLRALPCFSDSCIYQQEQQHELLKKGHKRLRMQKLTVARKSLLNIITNAHTVCLPLFHNISIVLRSGL